MSTVTPIRQFPTLLTIFDELKKAGRFQEGFHIRIENKPYMPLVIEDICDPGPDGHRVISVARYGERNGDLMRDPEMRCYERHQPILKLEHYLDVLERKPGALAGSKPLEQQRRSGQWPASFDTIWNLLMARQGKQSGNQADD